MGIFAGALGVTAAHLRTLLGAALPLMPHSSDVDLQRPFTSELQSP